MKREVARMIDMSRKICICSHLMPDADSIGSGLALMMMLRELGKEVRYYNQDPAPFPINQLPGYSRIEYRDIYPEPFDMVILIEGGDEKRTGQQNLVEYFTTNIDHHSTSCRDSNLNWIQSDASAVGELIFELAEEMNISLSRDMGFNLYAAIISDTGSFRYSNTTDRTLHIASQIVQKSGIVPYEVSRLLFSSNRLEKIQLIQRVLSTLQIMMDGKVAVIEYRRDFLPDFDLRSVDTEDIIFMARSILGIRVTLFFKEVDSEKYRVSIRSKDPVNAQWIARKFNGGGHDHAAGFYYEGNLANGKNRILREVAKQLNDAARTDRN